MPNTCEKKNLFASGSSKDEPICLLDSESETESDQKDKRKLLKRPRTCSNIEKNSTKKCSTFSRRKSYSNMRKSDLSSTCMLNPDPSPIKLFATKQDEELRKDHDSFSREHWSFKYCWTLREMLGIDGELQEGPIDFLILSTFIVDFDFLLADIPELVSIPNVTLFYGHSDNSNERWKKLVAADSNIDFIRLDPASPAQTESNPCTVQIPYGCHHSKFFIVGFRSGRLRIIIHTANMRYGDVHLKAQGAFIQDFLMKSDLRIGSEFEDSLSFYLESYRFKTSRTWIKGSEECSLVSQLRKYDFSTALGVLIPSVPGFHNPNSRQRVGYIKIQQAIENMYKSYHSNKNFHISSPIVCQFSSIGSLSIKYLNELYQAWNIASFHPVKQNNTRDAYQNFEFVYPTVKEINESVEGVVGGLSVPGRKQNVKKSFLQSLYKRWKSGKDVFKKGVNVPHVKTYYQVDLTSDEDVFKWFVLSSHNLSKAAWGEVQNTSRYGKRLKVFHWELGVFLSSESLRKERLVPFTTEKTYKDTEGIIPLSFAFRPASYGKGDEAWTVDN